jgi:hypothetical protein
VGAGGSSEVKEFVYGDGRYNLRGLVGQMVARSHVNDRGTLKQWDLTDTGTRVVGL